jgi:hypothetical protein
MLCEQRRLTAGVQKQNGFGRFEEPLSEQSIIPATAQPVINRIEQQAFVYSANNRTASRSRSVTTP